MPPVRLESSFAFDAHCVSRFVGLDSDSVSESISREAQSGYIWKGATSEVLRIFVGVLRSSGF